MTEPEGTGERSIQISRQGSEFFRLCGNMDAFRIIAERKIREAMEEGALENLSGKGKPLCFEDEAWIPEDIRVAFRLLRQAGHLPPELEARKEILSMRALIDTLDDNRERMKKLRELNYKVMSVNLLSRRPVYLEESDYWHNVTGTLLP